MWVTSHPFTTSPYPHSPGTTPLDLHTDLQGCGLRRITRPWDDTNIRSYPRPYPPYTVYATTPHLRRRHEHPHDYWSNEPSNFLVEAWVEHPLGTCIPGGPRNYRPQKNTPETKAFPLAYPYPVGVY